MQPLCSQGWECLLCPCISECFHVSGGAFNCSALPLRIFQFAEARLNPPTHFWIFPLLPTQPTIRPAACTLFRNIFHNCKLLVSAFIDMQNSFPSPRIHMLNYQITKMPFFKVLICEVSLNWELATKWDLKQLPLLSSATWLQKLFSLTTLGSAWLWILDLKFTF